MSKDKPGEFCVVCELPIPGNETKRGMGDGAGNKFAHEDCYWRAETKGLRIQLAVVERDRDELERERAEVCTLLGCEDELPHFVGKLVQERDEVRASHEQASDEVIRRGAEIQRLDAEVKRLQEALETAASTLDDTATDLRVFSRIDSC